MTAYFGIHTAFSADLKIEYWIRYC